MKSELIEKLNSLTSAVLEHRQEVNTVKRLTLDELTEATQRFYDIVFKRYGTLLKNTRVVYNSCEQYVVKTEHGTFSMGLAQTGFFSSIAEWTAYSFGHFYKTSDNNKSNSKEFLLRIKDFLDNVDWCEFDSQITEQAVKLFGKYEEETLKETL